MDALDRAASALRETRGVVVLTGAGVSAESGLGTFRDPDGMWHGRDPTRFATPEAFADDPVLISAGYDERRLAVFAAEPNPAHDALAALERHVVGAGGRFVLFTQNIDGLHRRAGGAAVVYSHGNLTVWLDHTTGQRVTPPPTPFETHPLAGPEGGLLRPDVVWFGEVLPRLVERAFGGRLRRDRRAGVAPARSGPRQGPRRTAGTTPMPSRRR